MPTYHLQSPVDATAEQLFAWHERPDCLHRLLPPWEDTHLVEQSGGLEVGAYRILDARLFGPARARWHAEHTWCERPTGFDDTQIHGPFTSWVHQHRFADGLLSDTVDWVPPAGALGLAIGGGLLSRRIDLMFQFRHQRTREDLSRTTPAKRIAITGSSGLVGKALTQFLRCTGHHVVPVVRSRDREGIYWNISDNVIDLEALEGFDAVVHLAGASIAEQPWTPDRKEVVLRSRVDGTHLLATALTQLNKPPEVLISGSAVGLYGDSTVAELTEDSPRGEGFLADVCAAWEAASAPASEAGIRVVTLRTGIVLSAAGGALAAQLPMYRAGGGGPAGPGTQWVPWIHLDDLVYAIHFAISDPSLHGPVNGTAPRPVAQRTLASAIGKALGRPAFLPAPAAALRLALGREMANELVLGGQAAVPRALLDAGYRFAHPELQPALNFELGAT